MNLSLLKAERCKKGITQETMAKHLGYKDKSSYCLMEKGKISITVDVASKIAEFLELSDSLTRDIFFSPEVQETSTSKKIIE